MFWPAATAFGFLGMLSTGGVTASGWMVDRYGRRRTATSTYAMTLLGFGLLFLLAVWPGTVLLALFVACFPFGAVMAVFGLAQFWLVPALAFGRRETA